MPHLTVECSGNCKELFETRELLGVMQQTLLGLGIYRQQGLRARLLVADEWIVADGSPQTLFVHVNVQVKPREDAVLQATGKALHEALAAWVQARARGWTCLLSVSMHLSPDAMYWSSRLGETRA